jgi:hypothetical protein
MPEDGKPETVRTARCCCGGLQVRASGEPRIVIACHCTECQRRTGSVFGVGAYFRAGQIRPSGQSKVYEREGQEGRKLRIHFCPECGGSVYWEPDILPGFLGVAVGAFADPQFPVPVHSVWEEARHPWVGFAHDLVCTQQQSAPRA